MKLDAVKLRNFRGYKAETLIPISDLTAFIGKNDVGKSSILEALEIFFNNSTVTCEKDDLSKNSEDNNIEITCTFTDIPREIVIDTAAQTSLLNEHLLNRDGKLEIKKVFTATAAKPKEKIFIVCNHPTVENGNDLLTLKRTELRQRANSLGIAQDSYNGNVNSSIRQAIWQTFPDLQLQEVELLVDKEDTKKVYEALEKYLPMYALFQSDRQSKDDDREVTDPMKIAVQQALTELNVELENIKTQVRNKAIDTANRTLAKLQEMSPELARELVPDFKTEPKFDSQFKLTIKSEDDIPINKRGSGIRRLILLNFFRAEAERRRTENQGNQVIFAFEEPETSQHPDHQEMLIKAFIELSNTDNSQILLTTHTPALAGLLPLESLRFIEKDGLNRTVQLGNDDVFEKIAETLGILPDPISKNATALLLVEGKSDVIFVNHTAKQLKNAGYISHTFEEKRFAIVPIGGCGNLKHWKTLKLAEQFNLPWCILIDSDKGTPEEIKNSAAIQELRQDGIIAYATRRREPENYIHYDCLQLQPGAITYSETDDAKQIISQAKSIKKENILEAFWTKMTAEQIREVEQYDDCGTTRYEFTEMFSDFLTLV
ncbi:MAG: AAA family ATPase [Melioribacter sp.]|nr:AAA family ATPase [Melioribacter sp.]